MTIEEATAALEPFVGGEGTNSNSNSNSKETKTRILPPAVLAAAVDGCVRRGLWKPLRALVDAGFVTSSTGAPGMVRALLEADRLEDVEAFLFTAADVSAEDLRLCLDACLCEGTSSSLAASANALAGSRRRRIAAAERAVVRAETLASRRSGDERNGDVSFSPRRRAHEARLAAACVECFSATSMPWASFLHVIVSRPIDPITAAETLLSVSSSAASKFASYLSTWLGAYADSASDVSSAPPPGVPSLQALVGWSSALIDAHFTSFAVAAMRGEDEHGGDGAAAAAMRDAADRLHAACEAIGKMGGALSHVAEGAALPEHQGVLSTTYSIEVVDW